jgi:subtilisin family serine protease
VLYRVSSVYNGIAVRADASARSFLAGLPGVKAIHALPQARPDLTSTVPLIGAPPVWEGPPGRTGTGIRIGIIDSGIDYVHTDFAGRGTADDYAAAHSAANNPATADTHPVGFAVLNGATQIYPSAKVVGGFDFAGDSYTGTNTPQPDPNPMDCDAVGHGSHVAGIAAGRGVNGDGTTYGGPYNKSVPFSSPRIGPGVAPQAQLYALRVFGCTGSTSLVTQALDWAVDPNGDGNPSDHLDVVNMSLGSSFGPPDTADAVASNNAADAGVIVVASAGNAGDVNFIAGSPASAARVIGVASSVDSTETTDGFNVNSPPAITGLKPALRSSGFNWAAMAPVTANLYYPATNQYGCSAWAGSDATNVSGSIVLVDWRKKLDVTFPCNSTVRANNAAAAGAAGLLMVDRTPTFATGITGNATIPAMYSVSAVGESLKSQLTPGVASSVSVTFSNAFANSAKLVFPGRTDTVSSFSSRGPAVGGGLKPDVAAPGDTVFSVGAGTGNQGVSFSGTSMAAPHIAGAMALLRQLHPTWTVEELKALVMNTADKDLFNGSNVTGRKPGLARAGVGRVDLPNAARGDVVAYDDTNPGAVSVAYGALEVTGTQSFDRTIRVASHCVADVTYTLGVEARPAVPGVSFSFPDGPTVAAPHGGAATFRVRLTLNAADLRHNHDPTLAEMQTSGSLTLARQWLSEVSGLVTMTPTPQPGKCGPPLRVPVYALVRPASSMAATDSGIDLTATSATLHLAGTDLNTGSTKQDYRSLVTPLELQGESTQLTTIPPLASGADLKNVGVTAHGGTIDFGIATWGDWATPGQENEFDVYIDTNLDSTDDYVLFNTRYTGTDIFVSGLRNLTTNVLVAQGFTNVDDGSGPTTAPFDTNVLVLPASLSALSPTGPTLTYHVVTFSSHNPGAPTDTAGPFTFNYSTPGLTFTGGTSGGGARYDDLSGGTITITINAVTAATDGALGVLLLHHLNAGGSRDEVVHG